jgi:predicted dehydrogenase
LKIMESSRRDFIKKTALGATALGLGLNAASYARVIGANDRMNFAIAGLNSRGQALSAAALSVNDCTITAICDVDQRVLDQQSEKIKASTGKKVKTYDDIRVLLESKDVDAIAIATPDHWHAPMAIMAVQAGKDVYVEKPCCYDPGEGELLVAVQEKYGQVVQMGNQQRSGQVSIQAMKDIQEGVIGDVYLGKAWYSNNRGSIGHGQAVEVPDWLNWDLWQGPAPRETYKDNIVHYNWHWFENWGTGEINNNGTHEIDICRWALGVDYPIRVTSSGGRYHFDDDWQFPDTQFADFEFEGGKMITWEGRSCNVHPVYDRGRGATIHGTEGTILLDRNTYELYDNKGNKVKEVTEDQLSATMDTQGVGSLDTAHMANFVDAIRTGAKQNAPINEGYKSNLLCHLGNIAQETGRALNTDPNDGHILNDPEAMGYWNRSYEPGWAPTL